VGKGGIGEGRGRSGWTSGPLLCTCQFGGQRLVFAHTKNMLACPNVSLPSSAKIGNLEKKEIKHPIILMNEEVKLRFIKYI